MKIVHGKKEVKGVKFDEMSVGEVYRDDDGDIVIRTDSGSVVILDTGEVIAYDDYDDGNRFYHQPAACLYITK